LKTVILQSVVSGTTKPLVFPFNYLNGNIQYFELRGHILQEKRLSAGRTFGPPFFSSLSRASGAPGDA